MDAAYAGVAAILPEQRAGLDGLELAHSFDTNCHKRAHPPAARQPSNTSLGWRRLSNASMPAAVMPHVSASQVTSECLESTAAAVANDKLGLSRLAWVCFSCTPGQCALRPRHAAAGGPCSCLWVRPWDARREVPLMAAALPCVLAAAGGCW